MNSIAAKPSPCVGIVAYKVSESAHFAGRVIRCVILRIVPIGSEQDHGGNEWTSVPDMTAADFSWDRTLLSISKRSYS